MNHYEKYKNSGIDWMGEIPAHWEIKRIKNLIRKKITDGPHETPEFVKEGVPFLSVDGIQNGELVFEDCRYITRDEHNRFQRKAVVEKGDILMGKAASIGKIARVKTDLDFGVWSPLAIIKPNELVENAFLEYYLKTPFTQYQIEILCTSNTQKNISMDDIPKIMVVTPPIAEQKGISLYLDEKTKKIDSLIQKKEKFIELLKEERTALINQAVTKGQNPKSKLKPSGVEWLGDIPEHWDVKKLKYITNIISKGTTPSTEGREILREGEIRFIKAENISNNSLIDEPRNFIDAETNEIIKRSKLQKNDILIVIAGATIGKTAIVSEDFLPANTNQAVCFLRLKENTVPKFIWYYLQSHVLIEQIWIDAVQSAQPNLSMEKIGNFFIPFPKREEQMAIIEDLEVHLTRTDNLIRTAQREIDLISEFRTALINEVVTGKIKVA